MNTTETNLTQQQADAIELAYPMHGEIVRDLIDRTERESGVSAEEKVEILAMPCLQTEGMRELSNNGLSLVGGVA